MPCGDLTRALFAVKSNSNVTLGEVLEGEAVFLYDDPSLDTVNNWEYHQGYTPATVTDPLRKKVDFLQEVINQVLPRKRDVENYELIEEKGYYLEDTEEALTVFKDKFKHEINTNVDYTLVNDDIVYGDEDTTTITFRKLMKDYNKVGSPEEVDEWLDKVVDKETLVGTQHRDQDNLVNDPANNITDTGLLELYENVVVRFINEMIGEADVYTSTTVTDDWIARTGEGPSRCPTTCADGDVYCEHRKCTGVHGAGMSYCFGGKQTIDNFNNTVISLVPPSRGNVPTEYRGNIHFDTNEPDPNVDPGSSRWAGLYSGELSYAANQPFHPQYWAGIDCSGLVQRCGEASVNSFSDSIVETLSLGRNSCQFFYDDFTCYLHREECIPLVITDPPSGFSHLFSAVDNAKRGDLVSYQWHISIIYSDPGAGGSYEIVHASGSDEICYTPLRGGRPVCGLTTGKL